MNTEYCKFGQFILELSNDTINQAPAPADAIDSTKERCALVDNDDSEGIESGLPDVAGMPLGELRVTDDQAVLEGMQRAVDDTETLPEVDPFFRHN